MFDAARRIVVLLLAMFFIAACGQKGPLFLPGDPSEIRATMPAQSGQEASEEDDDEEDIP